MVYISLKSFKKFFCDRIPLLLEKDANYQKKLLVKWTCGCPAVSGTLDDKARKHTPFRKSSTDHRSAWPCAKPQGSLLIFRPRGSPDSNPGTSAHGVRASRAPNRLRHLISRLQMCCALTEKVPLLDPKTDALDPKMI